MQRLQAVNPGTAKGKARELLDKVHAKYGRVPNLSRTLANSPSVLAAYLGFGALDDGSLSPALREQIALAVSELNGCDYCLAAHSALGKMDGLSEEQVLDSRQALSVDRKAEAALKFAKAVVEKRGWVSDADVARVRHAGYDDGEIAEIVAHVAKSMFANYFNHVADTDVDFPQAAARGRPEGQL